ncbi:DUF6599 family protein [Thermodesulfobacteriota bacterium]
MNFEEGSSLAKPLDVLQKNLPVELLGWKAEKKDLIFNNETIFDYIDGAGEVYRAYDMRNCLSRRFKKPNNPDIILDIFVMGTSENAFGVFTHDQDGEETDIGQGALYRYGWLRFWKDKYFVSIYPEEETKTTRRAVIELGNTVASFLKKEGSKPRILSALPLEGLQSKSIRYLHDPAILNYHYYLSDENILFLGDETDVALAEYRRGEKSAILLLALYPSLDKAIESHGNLLRSYMPDSGSKGIARLENGKWSASRLKNRIIVFVLEADSRSFAEGLVREVMELAPE